MMMLEYWNNPEETAKAFQGDWFHSGDLAREDDEGYLYVVDRSKDMIITGGENVYSAEVEDVLAAHPKIAQAALIAIPHEKWGETPLAVVTAREKDDPPTSEDIAQWCKGKLARYKHPTRLAVLADLPRNPSGKVLKTRLRADHAAGTLPSKTL
jgi:fatty-acyl-CoA synthase